MAEFIDMSQHVDAENKTKSELEMLFNLKSTVCQSLKQAKNILNDEDKVNEELQLLILTENILQTLKSLNEQWLKLVKTQVQNTFENVNISKEDFSIEETNIKFLKYHEAYIQLKVFLEKLFQNLNKRSNFNVQNCEEILCVFYSTPKDDLASCVSIFNSSKQHFQEIESSLKNGVEISCQDFDNAFKSIKGIMNKAEIACNELTKVASKFVS